MDGEVVPATATLKEARYWTQVYNEILTMEEKVLARVRTLMTTQSLQVKQEVELTNLPVIVAQVERFRQRLSYWNARVEELNDGSDSTGQGESEPRLTVISHGA